MKKHIAFNLALIVSLICFGSLAFCAEVIQGKCLSYDQASQIVTVEEYNLNFDKDFPYGHPTGVQATVNLKDAEIGAPPEVDDILRIAYVVNGEEKNAIKVMNVSKQSLKK